MAPLAPPGLGFFICKMGPPFPMQPPQAQLRLLLGLRPGVGWGGIRTTVSLRSPQASFLTFHSKPPTARPPAAPVPARPMNKPLPTLLDIRDAPICKAQGVSLTWNQSGLRALSLRSREEVGRAASGLGKSEIGGRRGSGGGQRERGVELTFIRCLLYARHCARHFMCAKILNIHKDLGV